MDTSGALLYDPVVNQNIHSHNTLFQPSFSVKNGLYGNEDLDLVILHSYMIPEYDLKHFYTVSVHFYMIPEHFYMIPC